jgi:hypothetical protein
MFAGTLRLKVVETLTLQSAICNIGFGERGNQGVTAKAVRKSKKCFKNICVYTCIYNVYVYMH